MDKMLNWLGTKERQVPILTSHFPKEINRYFEPFVGSGACYLATDANEYFINDRCELLAEMYRMVKSGNRKFFAYVELMNESFKAIDKLYEDFMDEFLVISDRYCLGLEDFCSVINILKKYTRNMNYAFMNKYWRSHSYSIGIEIEFQIAKRMQRIARNYCKDRDMSRDKQREMIRAALKAAIYTHFRDCFNMSMKHNGINEEKVAMFFFVTMYNTTGLYVKNKDNTVTIPYGGMKYNDKVLDSHLYWFHNDELRKKLSKTHIGGVDWIKFLHRNPPLPDDFIYFDPPELGNFNKHGGYAFELDDHKKLAKYMAEEKVQSLASVQNKLDIINIYLDEGLFPMLNENEHMNQMYFTNY